MGNLVSRSFQAIKGYIFGIPQQQRRVLYSCDAEPERGDTINQAEASAPPAGPPLPSAPQAGPFKQDQRSRRCIVCARSLMSDDDYEEHKMQIVHDRAVLNCLKYHCYECPAIFAERDQFQDHLDFHS